MRKLQQSAIPAPLETLYNQYKRNPHFMAGSSSVNTGNRRSSCIAPGESRCPRLAALDRMFAAPWLSPKACGTLRASSKFVLLKTAFACTQASKSKSLKLSQNQFLLSSLQGARPSGICSTANELVAIVCTVLVLSIHGLALSCKHATSKGLITAAVCRLSDE